MPATSGANTTSYLRHQRCGRTTYLQVGRHRRLPGTCPPPSTPSPLPRRREQFILLTLRRAPIYADASNPQPPTGVDPAAVGCSPLVYSFCWRFDSARCRDRSPPVAEGVLPPHRPVRILGARVAATPWSVVCADWDHAPPIGSTNVGPRARSPHEQYLDHVNGLPALNGNGRLSMAMIWHHGTRARLKPRELNPPQSSAPIELKELVLRGPVRRDAGPPTRAANYRASIRADHESIESSAASVVAYAAGAVGRDHPSDRKPACSPHRCNTILVRRGASRVELLAGPCQIVTFRRASGNVGDPVDSRHGLHDTPPPSGYHRV